MSDKRSVSSPGDLPAGLAQPARRALAGRGITHLDQLTMLSEAEIAQLHGIGPQALDQLRRALAASGRAFGSQPPTHEQTAKQPWSLVQAKTVHLPILNGLTLS